MRVTSVLFIYTSDLHSVNLLVFLCVSQQKDLIANAFYAVLQMLLL